MSTVIGRFRRTAVMAAVLAAALGAVFVSQTQAYAGGVSVPPSPTYCQNHPWEVQCGG